MLRQQLTTIILKYSSGVLPSSPFQQFLSNRDPSLIPKRVAQRSVNSQDIYVSHVPVTRLQAESFMKKKTITNKKVLINVDSSHLMGIKRMTTRAYLQKNVYKGNGQPTNVLTQQNPQTMQALQQLQFQSTPFFTTDPYYLDQQRKNVPHEEIIAKMTEMYDKDRARGGKRLLQEYSIPPEYVPIIQAAHNLDNKIYFIGINQYDLRHIICSYLKLNQIKVLFMESLKYASEQLQQSEIDSLWRFKCKQYLWLEHYGYLQPITYQQIKLFKQKIKGHYFSHPYTFLRPEHPEVNLSQLNDTQTDSNKLQKHAILSVLFGNIWKQPYTNNPFPYLAQPYRQLQMQDKQLVIDLYNQHYNRYSAAKTAFFQQMKQQQQQV